jgi:hypothetical protein
MAMGDTYVQSAFSPGKGIWGAKTSHPGWLRQGFEERCGNPAHSCTG